MSFTLGDVFTDEYYVDYAKQCESEGADSICIKDMAALLTPYRAASLTKALKDNIRIPVGIHTHYTSGLASMCLLKAIENGADIVDTTDSDYVFVKYEGKWCLVDMTASQQSGEQPTE